MTSLSTLAVAETYFKAAAFTVNTYATQLASNQRFQPGDPGFSISLTPQGEDALRSGLDTTLNGELKVFTDASANASTIQSDVKTLENDLTTLSQSNISGSVEDAAIADFENTLNRDEGLLGTSSPFYANPFGSATLSITGSINGGQLTLTGGGPIADALAETDAEVNDKPGNGSGNGFGSHTIDLKKPSDAATLLEQFTNTFEPQIDIAATGLANDVTTIQGSIAQNQAVGSAAKVGENAQFGIDSTIVAANLAEAQRHEQNAASAIDAIIGNEVALDGSFSQMLQTTENAILAYQKPQTQFPTITNLLA